VGNCLACLIKADHRFRFLVVEFYQHDITGMAFDQRSDATVIGAFDQITFPMTGYRTVFDGGR